MNQLLDELQALYDNATNDVWTINIDSIKSKVLREFLESQKSHVDFIAAIYNAFPQLLQHIKTQQKVIDALSHGWKVVRVYDDNKKQMWRWISPNKTVTIVEGSWDECPKLPEELL